MLDALAKADRRRVAGMVRYRLVVDADGMAVPIVDEATLLNESAWRWALSLTKAERAARFAAIVQPNRR